MLPITKTVILSLFGIYKQELLKSKQVLVISAKFTFNCFTITTILENHERPKFSTFFLYLIYDFIMYTVLSRNFGAVDVPKRCKKNFSFVLSCIDKRTKKAMTVAAKSEQFTEGEAGKNQFLGGNRRNGQ